LRRDGGPATGNRDDDGDQPGEFSVICHAWPMRIEFLARAYAITPHSVNSNATGPEE
jgi:hypothetical protein